MSATNISAILRMSRSAKRCMTSARESDLLQKVKSVVPNLVNSMHKVIHFYKDFYITPFFLFVYVKAKLISKLFGRISSNVKLI